MGHAGRHGDIEHVYTTKKLLPPEGVERLRGIFGPADTLLTTHPQPNEDDQRKRDWLKLAELSGWLGNEELQLLRDQLLKPAIG